MRRNMICQLESLVYQVATWFMLSVFDDPAMLALAFCWMASTNHQRVTLMGHWVIKSQTPIQSHISDLQQFINAQINWLQSDWLYISGDPKTQYIVRQYKVVQFRIRSLTRTATRRASRNHCMVVLSLVRNRKCDFSIHYFYFYKYQSCRDFQPFRIPLTDCTFAHHFDLSNIYHAGYIPRSCNRYRRNKRLR